MDGVRNRGTLKVLTDEQVDAIHEASLRILERTGIRYDGEDATERLLKAGAARHPSRRNVLTFPRTVVEGSIRKIPRYGTYHARDPKNDLRFDGEHTYAHSLGGNPSMIDPESGGLRPSTLRDVEETTRVMDALANCHSVSSLVVATDVPAPLLVVKTMQAMMTNTTKCVSGYALKTEEVDAQVRMWACVAGGHEELRRRPLFTLYGSPTSPLTYDAHVCDVMLRSATYGIPVDIVPCPISGTSAPQSLAGGLAQQNAELLAGVMLLQTVNSDLPVQYSGRLSMLDMRSGKNIWGLPEMGLASAATVQIAHRYHMTADVYGVTMDGNMWDVQAGLERMMCALLPALAGADNLSGMGGAWENAGSHEMLIIDDEIYADVFRAIQGIGVDEDRLALEVIEKVGPMGNFLAQRHTMKYVKMGEVRISSLYDKRTMEKAKREGIRSLQENAKDSAKRILREHSPMALDQGITRELESVVKAEGKLLLAHA